MNGRFFFVELIASMDEADSAGQGKNKKHLPSEHRARDDAKRRTRQNERLLRTLSLLEALRGRLKWDLDGLAREFQVSKQTIRRDLSLLDSVGIISKFDASVRAIKLTGMGLPVPPRVPIDTPETSGAAPSRADDDPPQTEPDDPSVIVELEFTPEGDSFVQALIKYHSTAQVQCRDDGSAIVKLEVSDADEIADLLLNFWTGVAKVVGPPEIRDTVVARLRQTLAVHESPDDEAE